MSKRNSTWPYWLALTACVAAILWYGRNDIRPLIEEIMGKQSAPVKEVAPAQSGPRYPIAPPKADASDADSSASAPLPPLAESDSYFRAILINIFGDSLDGMLASDKLVEKFVATVDGLSTAKPSRKPWPVKTSLTEFKVVATTAGATDGTTDAAVGTTGAIYMSPENYTRFDFFVNMATSPAPETVADAYRHMYPLFQEAYVGLGYPDGYFNDRLVEVIDHLLKTPEPAEPIFLVQPRVYYEFADPKLEALSGGQKLLIRMGSENAAKIRQMLQALRGLIGVRP